MVLISIGNPLISTSSSQMEFRKENCCSCMFPCCICHLSKNCGIEIITIDNKTDDNNESPISIQPTEQNNAGNNHQITKENEEDKEILQGHPFKLVVL